MFLNRAKLCLFWKSCYIPGSKLGLHPEWEKNTLLAIFSHVLVCFPQAGIHCHEKSIQLCKSSMSLLKCWNSRRASRRIPWFSWMRKWVFNAEAPQAQAPEIPCFRIKPLLPACISIMYTGKCKPSPALPADVKVAVSACSKNMIKQGHSRNMVHI